MLNTTNYLANTTDINRISNVIDDILGTFRISGSLLLREAYASPWSIAIPRTKSLGTLLKVNPAVRAIAFHLVEFGHCAVKTEGNQEILLKAGEIAISFGGDAHQLYQGQPAKSESIETLLAGGPNIQQPNPMAQSGSTGLLCGVFLLQETAFNPLFTALPSLMHTRLTRPGELHNLSGVARLMAEELDRKTPGGGYIIERLLEVLCAEAIRSYIETAPVQQANWFRGIRDPVVGRTIAAIHERPGENWSVMRLAEDVAMSPSRFAARFSESVGDSPMAYVTKWRMNVACRQLTGTHKRIDQIATDVGYESLATFSRAFKKNIGVSPSAWRTFKKYMD